MSAKAGLRFQANGLPILYRRRGNGLNCDFVSCHTYNVAGALPVNPKIGREFGMILGALPHPTEPMRLPLIVLDAQVVFPNVVSMVSLRNEADRATWQDARRQRHTVIAAMAQPARNGSEAEGVCEFGTEIAPGPFLDEFGEGAGALAQGRRRVRIVNLHEFPECTYAESFVVDDAYPDSQLVISRLEQVLNLFKRSSQYAEAVPDNVIKHALELEDPGQLCDALAAILPLSADLMQRLLEAADVELRLEILAEAMGSELDNTLLHEEVHTRLQDEIAANQREMYLREQLRLIQQELGDGDVFQQELKELGDKIKAAKLPSEIHEKAMKELSRLGVVPPMSPESGVIHTYLDRLLTLPWHAASEENLDLAHAERVLDEAHYGLRKVKTRIIEHIAVRKLARDKMKSPILCFVGPPGVGKTSLGKSIAEALGCAFLRISLGGVRDEAEIRGHRRTYIGSMPGRILQQMERAETVNPVFMLDEIDKMNADFRGDPAAALLEVLDPEQNRNFVDHYLEAPYDLSRVTFITTANELYGIPEALEDRLEVIDFKGYSEEEKIQIAQRFLIPKQLEANGIEEAGIRFPVAALQHIIRHYTYESGVRNLEREIANICRKVARQLAAGKRYKRRISARIAEKYLGPPQVLDSRVNRKDAVGIASGLVWTPNGGDIQTIEVTLLPGKGNLTLTGQLGDVLQESAHIGLSYLRARARDFDLPADDFDNYDIHIHMPEGAVQKDGPSAGITLCAALVSAWTEAKLRSDYAMTGELTLRGHILPVGGVAEKVMAARRRGIPRILLPKDNEKDLRELSKAVLRDVAIVFIDDMQAALELILLDAPGRRQRDIEADKRGRDGSGGADE